MCAHHVKLDVAANVKRVDADPLARHAGQRDVDLWALCVSTLLAKIVNNRHQELARTLMGSCSPRDVSTVSSLSTCTVIKYSVRRDRCGQAVFALDGAGGQ